MTDSTIAQEVTDLLRLKALGGDLYAFALYYLERDPANLRREIYEHLSSHKKSLYLIPMGHWKSTTVTETLPIYLPCMNRDIRIIIGSETGKRSTKASMYCRDVLTSNKKIIADFGEFKGSPWTQDEWAVCGRSPNVSHPTVAAVGADGAIIGGRVDVVILDDIVSKKNSQTAHQQTMLTSWVDETITSRLDPSFGKPWPQGSTWIVGNMFHPRDTLSTIAERKTFSVMKKEAWTDPARTKLLLPEQWTVEDLREREEDTPFAFELCYMNNPGGLSDAPFKPDWFRYWTEDPKRVNDPLCRLLPPRQEMRILQGWDLAATQSETADYSVCWTCGVHQRSASYYWLDVWRDRVQPHQLIDQIALQATLHNPEKINIESNGFQVIVAQTAARDHPQLMSKIVPVKTSSNRSKVDRIISGLQPSYARMAHYFREFGMDTEIMEIQHFPGAPHDDAPDAQEITIRDLTVGRITHSAVPLALGKPM